MAKLSAFDPVLASTEALPVLPGQPDEESAVSGTADAQ